MNTNWVASESYTEDAEASVGRRNFEFNKRRDWQASWRGLKEASKEEKKQITRCAEATVSYFSWNERFM